MYDNDETMVENEDLDTEADDTLEDEIEEEEDESEEPLNPEEDGEQEEEPEAETRQPSEPGWIKQRVSKAVERAVAETERRMQAEFDRQMAPIRQKMLEDEAKELVRQGEFKSLDRAKEYLSLKQGLPPVQNQPQPQAQPRNSQGQYAPKEDPATSARIDMLAHQVDSIKAKTGMDVISVFESDPDIKRKVISGEMDFYDVAELMRGQQRRRPPAPMRSPNGASGQQSNAITSMSDEQFRRLEKRISEGARITLK